MRTSATVGTATVNISDVSCDKKLFSFVGNRKDRIDQALMNVIVQDSKPFIIVEDVGFLDPTCILPSRQTLKSMMETKFTEEKEKAKEEVLRATAVTLTSDIWTSIHMDSY